MPTAEAFLYKLSQVWAVNSPTIVYTKFAIGSSQLVRTLFKLHPLCRQTQE